MQQTAEKKAPPRVAWQSANRTPPPDGHAVQRMFRLVTTADSVVPEMADSFNATGEPNWRKVGLGDIPDEARRYLARLMYGAVDPRAVDGLGLFEPRISRFRPALDARTSPLVQQLAGMPLDEAAEKLVLHVEELERAAARRRLDAIEAGPVNASATDTWLPNEIDFALSELVHAVGIDIIRTTSPVASKIERLRVAVANEIAIARADVDRRPPVASSLAEGVDGAQQVGCASSGGIDSPRARVVDARSAADFAASVYDMLPAVTTLVLGAARSVGDRTAPALLDAATKLRSAGEICESAARLLTRLVQTAGA